MGEGIAEARHAERNGEGEGVKIYGWKRGAMRCEELAPKGSEYSEKGAERMRAKQHCKDVRRKIPQILRNDLLDPWRDHLPNDGVCACCQEDAVALEVEDEPL